MTIDLIGWRFYRANILIMGGVLISLLKKFNRFVKPFKNRKASSLGRVFGTIMSTFLIVMFLAWFIMKGTDIFVRARANTLCNRFSDVIAENGKITAAMQTELYKDFNKLKFFTGDYEVQFLTYDYTNPGAKVSLGTSTNGSSVPEATVARGKIIQVTFRSSESSLDKITKVFNRDMPSAGLTASSAMKVD